MVTACISTLFLILLSKLWILWLLLFGDLAHCRKSSIISLSCSSWKYNNSFTGIILFIILFIIFSKLIWLVLILFKICDKFSLLISSSFIFSISLFCFIVISIISWIISLEFSLKFPYSIISLNSSINWSISSINKISIFYIFFIYFLIPFVCLFISREVCTFFSAIVASTNFKCCWIK